MISLALPLGRCLGSWFFSIKFRTSRKFRTLLENLDSILNLFHDSLGLTIRKMFRILIFSRKYRTSRIRTLLKTSWFDPEPCFMIPFLALPFGRCKGSWFFRENSGHYTSSYMIPLALPLGRCSGSWFFSRKFRTLLKIEMRWDLA